MSYEIDPDDRATWRNFPEPPIFPYLKREIRKIGGVHSSGKPFLRLVWMPDVWQFFAGEKWRLYNNTALDPLTWTVHKLERPICDAAGKEIRREVRFAPDLTVVNAVLEEDKKHQEGWIYIPDLRYEYIAHQRFCVEQFFPTEMWEACGFSSPQRWEADRYGEFEHPITGLITPRMDLLGPYPAPGRYEIAAQDLICEEVINDERGRKTGTKYRAPGPWLLEEVKRMKRERDNFNDTPANRSAFLKSQAEKIERSRRAHYEEIAAETLDILKPIAHTFSDKLARIHLNDHRPKSAPGRNQYGRVTSRIVAG